MFQRLPAFIIVTLLVSASAFNPAAIAQNSSALQQGIDLYNTRNYNAAAQFFEAWIKDDPKNATAYYYAALCFAQLGQTQRARETFGLIVKYFPKTPEAKLSARGLQSLPGTAASTSGSTQPPAASGRSALDILPDSDSVPFTRVGGTIYVNTIVNGRPLRMVFDTGADHCQIGLNHMGTLKAAADAGRQTQVMGVGGLSKVSQSSAEIKLGKISRNCAIMIQDNMRTEPLLGQTFFSPFVCQFDNGAGLIHFYKRASKSYAAGYDTVEVPYTQSGNNLVVYPKILVGSEEYQVPMILDTGASRTMISQFMVPVPIPQDARLLRAGGISGFETVIEAPVQRLELGAISKVGMKVLLSRGTFNLLGQDFLGDRKYTVDPEKKVIRFSR
jgi:tetratricopeptide (TPR) repeat protein